MSDNRDDRMSDEGRHRHSLRVNESADESHREREPLLRPDDRHEAEAARHAVPVDPLNVEPGLLKKAKDHLSFPTGGRFSGYALKVLWGLLLGAGTLVGIMALVPTAHFLIIGLLTVGAISYTAKTLWDIRKKHKEEKQLLHEVNHLVDESMDEFEENAEFDVLESLVDALEHAPVKPDAERLYAHVCELEESLDRIKPLAAAKKTSDPHNPNNRAVQFGNYLRDNHVEQRLRDFKTRIDRFRGPHQGEPYHHHHRQIVRAAPVKKEKSWFHSPRVFFQKLGNRAMDFLGGATAGVAIGVGVLSFVAGAAAAGALLSNPVGWAMLGIILGAVAVGTLAVVINYTVSRGQQKKIDNLSHTKSGLENTNAGLKHIKNSMRQMADIQQHARTARENSGQVDQLQHELQRQAEEHENTTSRVLGELREARTQVDTVVREKDRLQEQHERVVSEAHLDMERQRQEKLAVEAANQELVLQHERLLRDVEDRDKRLDTSEREKRNLERVHERAIQEAETRQKRLDEAEQSRRELEERHLREMREAEERVSRLHQEMERAAERAKAAEQQAAQLSREKAELESHLGKGAGNQ